MNSKLSFSKNDAHKFIIQDDVNGLKKYAEQHN